MNEGVGSHLSGSLNCNYMKKFLMLLAIVLASGGVVNAQIINTGLNASVKANVGAGQHVKASSTVDVDDNDVDEDTDTRSAGSVEVDLEANEVEDWTDQQKSDFLLTVKQHAQLRSGQDLELFAKGVMAADANVRKVEADESHVEISYKMPAKFLGLFRTELSANTDVKFDEKAHGNGPKEVTVRFPWYRMFYSLDSDVRSDILKAAVEASVKSEGNNGNATSTAAVSARNGRVIQLISNILKGIRANAEADAKATVR